jgi:hypothetical protein
MLGRFLIASVLEVLAASVQSTALGITGCPLLARISLKFPLRATAAYVGLFAMAVTPLVAAQSDCCCGVIVGRLSRSVYLLVVATLPNDGLFAM